MQDILNVITNHQVIAGMVLLWLFSALVSGMPTPTDKDTRGYVWAYNSLHAFSANLQQLGVKTGGQDAHKTGN